ncbi:scarecrow-like protein 14 [Argentina anserina]|uniref:scarecrow-like protein 14 n=1 Tax=Argentina anserina TaxID=57926 RepID=UPI002176307A|nr:scarecrow-like protein 14 [Potentilla anserina]
MASVACELIWLKALLLELGISHPSPIVLYCDNQAAMHIAANPVFHERTKHIEVDYHFIRNQVQAKVMETVYTRSCDQIADLFTKILSSAQFERLLSKLGLTKKWETLQFDDLKVQRNEVLAVNCLCRFKYLLDESVIVPSPRDTVLKLVRKLNPDVFVQSVVNGSHHAPFFVTRFRAALYHFSALFDLLDANILREDQMRLGFEKELIGREVLNIVACEGSKRIVRSETYQQWQIRNMRAGFRQLPLDGEVMKNINDKVDSSSCYLHITGSLPQVCGNGRAATVIVVVVVLWY